MAPADCSRPTGDPRRPSNLEYTMSTTPDNRPVADRAKEVVESFRPYIQADGGDIDFVSCEDGIVTVRLRGACSGCPHAAMTLKMGVERNLKKQVPEVKEVVSI
jgi:Fe-S cluster biogenesis protein NfuA